MRATSLGHAGILIETDHGSIVCDPWFVPAFFGSWFVVPAQRPAADAGLLARSSGPTTSTSPTSTPTTSTSRGSREHVDRGITVLLPGYPTASSSARCAALGFTDFIRTGTTGRGARPRRARPSPSTSRRRSPTARAATRRSSSTTATSASSTRTTAAPRPRRPAPPTARSTCTGCSTAARSGTRWSTTMPAERDADAGRRQGREPVRPGDALRRGGRGRGPSCRAPGRRASSTPSCSTSTSSTATS